MRASLPIPEDPTAYAGRGQADSVGCSLIRCRKCQQPVRNQVGLLPKRDASDHAGEIYASGDWRTLPWFDQGPNGRVYACPCGVWFELGTHRLARTDDTDETLPPWYCSGHPRASLPIVVDGVKIDAATDIATLVRGVILGKAPPPGASAMEKTFFGAWLAKLHDRLTKTAGGEPLAVKVSTAVADLVRVAKDPVSLAEVIAFFRIHPFAPGAEKLVRTFLEAPATFVGVTVPHMKPPMLEDVLAWFASERIRHSVQEGKPLDALTLDLVVRGVVDSTRRFEAFGKSKGKDRTTTAETARRWRQVLPEAAALDAGAVADRAAAIIQGAPGLAKELLQTLAQVGSVRLAQVADLVARAPGVDLAGLRRLAAQLTGPARATILSVLEPGDGKKG